MCTHYAKNGTNSQHTACAQNIPIGLWHRKEAPDDLNNGEIKNHLYFFQQILIELLLCVGVLILRVDVGGMNKATH